MTVETPRIILHDPVDLRLDWDGIGILFTTFGIACAGLATVLYSVDNLHSGLVPTHA